MLGLLNVRHGYLPLTFSRPIKKKHNNVFIFGYPEIRIVLKSGDTDIKREI
jgi:hypothetical protein